MPTENRILCIIVFVKAQGCDQLQSRHVAYTAHFNHHKTSTLLARDVNSVRSKAQAPATQLSLHTSAGPNGQLTTAPHPRTFTVICLRNASYPLILAFIAPPLSVRHLRIALWNLDSLHLRSGARLSARLSPCAFANPTPACSESHEPRSHRLSQIAYPVRRAPGAIRVRMTRPAASTLFFARRRNPQIKRPGST
jgi:hypothetical protein